MCQCAIPLALKLASHNTLILSIQICIEIIANERLRQASEHADVS